MEEEFARVETASIVKAFLTTRDSRPPCIPKEMGFDKLVPAEDSELPAWLKQDDINYYASKFSKTGFTGGLNYYRNLDKYIYIYMSFFDFCGKKRGENMKIDDIDD